MQQSIYQAIQQAQKTVPVDVDALAEAIGVKIRYKHLPKAISGELVRVGNGYEININNTDPRTRQRFTLAHELGHYALHRSLIGDGVNDDRAYRTTTSADHYNPKIGPKQETEANRFAASLLMPWPLINQLSDEGRGLAELANMLNVSKHAISIRLGVPYEQAHA